MPDLDQMIQPGRPAPSAWTCKVIRAPASPTGTVLVEIDDTGRDEQIGRRWMPRGTTLPAKGDLGLVVYDERGDGWLTVWHPA